MDDKEIRQTINRYKFYHIIKLTDQISTPGNPQYLPAQNICLKVLKNLDLKAMRVLDVGCRDGLFSFAAESMGAGEVIGIDNDLSKPATEFLIPYFKSKVKMQKMNLYDLKPDDIGLFDVIIFPGVLYHLRYPFFALKVLRGVLKPGGRLIIETAIWKGKRGNAMLFCPIGKDSPYEPTSCAFFNEKGLTDTLRSLGFETVSVQYSRNRRLKHRLLRGKTMLSNLIVKLLSLGTKSRIQGLDIHRGIFDCRYHGPDQNAFETKYWERTHDYHTIHGG